MPKKAPALAILLAVLLAALPGCKQLKEWISPGDKELDQIAADNAEAAAAIEAEAAKPAPKPEPKMNETLYIEIAARSVLIRQKFAETPDEAETEIEKVHEKLGVTAAEYKEFLRALGPKADTLQKQVQEKMQTLENEYK